MHTATERQLSLRSSCTLATLLLAACASRPAPADVTAPDRVDVTDATSDLARIEDAIATDTVSDAPAADAEPARDAAPSADAGDDAPRAACSGRTGLAGEFDRTVSVDGRDRRFVLHVPRSYVPTRATALVFNFHGFTDSPEGQERISHLFQVADERGFIAVNPAGVSGSWNAGVCCGLAQITGVDDVHFTRVLLELLAGEYCVDPARVYATGFSNGGFFAHRLGCEMADRIAAIGPVAGEMGLSSCAPGRPVPVAMVHGTSDPVVPYDGNPLLGFPSTATTIMGWVTRDGCNPMGREIYRSGPAHCDQYSGCTAGADVVLCTVDGMDHGWPGGGSLWTADGGRPSGFVTTDYLMDFFEHHPRP